MKTGVTGASGQLGRKVLAGLKEKVSVDDLVALVRSPDKFSEPGIEVRMADYEDPESLNKALNGIDTLLLISANEIGKRIRQHKNVIEAAKSAGVQWIIYTSLLHADTSSLSLAVEHLETEAFLKQSGIPYTILRNGWYTENYTNSISGSLTIGKFLGSAGEGRISAAARSDYAEAAVAVLTTAGHQGKTYELAGDQSFTLAELAAEISRQTGRDIPYVNLPENEYSSILNNLGLPEMYAAAIASWDTAASRGDLEDDSRELSKLIGHQTTPMSNTVTEALS